MLAKNKFTKLFLIIFIAGLLGCSGESATGPGEEEAPSVPNLEKSAPDVTFFSNNNPKLGGSETEVTSNFYLAKSIVTSMNSFFGMGNIYATFLNPVNSNDATYNDGVWEWTYSINRQGNTAEIRTTAEKLSDGSIKWAMFWSFDTETLTLENYKVLEGTATEDGSEGSWTFNSLNPDSNQEEVALVTDWTITSDTEKDMSIKAYDNGVLIATITFERSGSDFMMVIDNVESSNDVIVTWNSETQTGSITYEGTEHCWDSNFQNTACN